MVLGQYMASLAGTWWYWVILSWFCLVLGDAGQHTDFMPVYIEKVENWSSVTNASHSQTKNIELLSLSKV